MHDLGHIFYDFHHCEVKTAITTRLSGLIVANAMATLLTNPFDVCLTKLLTQ